MEKIPVGLNDISVYIPRPEIDLDRISQRRIAENPELERHLKRAQITTGQQRFRFPALWEDTTTLASEAARGLLDRLGNQELSSLRFIAVGTETPVDHSKPVAAYVQGVLKREGRPVPENIATFQVQHACAGGALAAVSVGALLSVNCARRESGMVICSDIARYTVGTTAEVTQGSGAVALHLATNPELLSLDLDTQGFASDDVDDFFRPLGRTTASVRGGYSMKCYLGSFESALRDHCERRGESPEEVLAATDLFVLHAPFRNMPLIAMEKILAKHLGLSAEQAEDFLAVRGFFAGIDPVSRIGNTYTASLFLSLAFSLRDRYLAFGDDIVGKRVLLVSYGSGNTMAVISGRVAAGAPQVIDSWDLDSVWDSARPGDEQEYDEWINRPTTSERYEQALRAKSVPEDAVYLDSIRDDGYRVYRIKQSASLDRSSADTLLEVSRQG